MHRPSVVLWGASAALLALLAPFALAQEKVEATDVANHPFSVPFASESRLNLRVRSGEVRVVGTDQSTISVELSGTKAHTADAKDLKVRFRREDGGGFLRILGGPKNGITITVRVPAKIDLYARVPFGDVRVEKIDGNKDVELHAGDLTVDVGDSEAYSRVDATVYTGEVDASAFGETHGGLFRSFKRTGAGKYRLHAHVGAGQLTLQ